MSCKKPLVRICKLGEYEINQKGKMYNKAKIEPYNENYATMIEKKYVGNYKYELIGCGQCIACRLAKAQEWANRCMLESQQYKENYFITLTYDEEHKPKKEEIEINGITYPEQDFWNGTLVKKDMTDFIKRLRRKWEYDYNFQGIRYFYCGEYGTETQRPHYHMIAFNLPIPSNELRVYKQNWQNDTYYICDKITKIWGKGHVILSPVTWNTCNYVARYTTKKITGKKSDEYYAMLGQEKPFIEMSRMPGIGKNYYEKHKKEIYENDNIIITKGKKAITVKPSKYYDSLYDIDYPEDMEKIKKKREKLANNATKLKLSKTSLNLFEQNQVELRTLEEKSKALIRNKII